MGRAPRVAFVTHEASRTGAPLLLLTLQRWLAATRSFEIVTVIRRNGPLTPDFAEVGPVILTEGQRTPRALATTGRGLTRMTSSTRLLAAVGERAARLALGLRGKPVDLIYNNGCNGLLVVLLRRLTGAPVITHMHDLEFGIEQQGPGNMHRVLATTDRFIATSRAVADNLTARHGVAAGAIEVVYGASTVPKPDARQREVWRREVRRALGIAPDAEVVGFLGSLDWRKGADMLPAIAALVERALPGRTHHLWVGGATHLSRRQLEHDSAVLGLSGRAHLVGSVSDPLRYLCAIDVLVLPSREEPLGLVALEAALAGAPTVCFGEAGGTREFVEPDRGVSVPYLDVSAMSDAVVRLLVDAPLRTAMAERAAAQVERAHRVEVVGPRVVDVIGRTMTEPRRRLSRRGRARH